MLGLKSGMVLEFAVKNWELQVLCILIPFSTERTEMFYYWFMSSIGHWTRLLLNKKELFLLVIGQF